MWKKGDKYYYSAFNGMVSLSNRGNFYDLSLTLGSGISHYEIMENDWNAAKQKAELIIIEVLTNYIDSRKVEIKKLENLLDIVKSKSNTRQECTRTCE